MQEAWAADALAALGGVATVDELAAAVLASMAPGESLDLPPARLAAAVGGCWPSRSRRTCSTWPAPTASAPTS